MNIIMAVSMGGDDFIAKPFDLPVLIAKIQALLRRTYDFTLPKEELEHKGLLLHKGNTTMTYEGETKDLTKNEYRILEVLFEHKGEVVSRSLLMNRLWETDSYVDENTLTVNVTRLRKKLENLGCREFIVTKKGLGYLVP